MISYSVAPRGVETVTFSPTLRLRTARPTGEAWESLPLPGSDSLAPTIRKMRSWPAGPPGVGEVAAPRVRLVGAHNLEDALLAAVDHPQRDARPEVHRVGADLGGVHDLGVADAALDLADPALQKPLLGLGVVVLGVLGDVPELPRLPDAVGARKGAGWG